MPHNRINDLPEDGIYVSRARQAIEEQSGYDDTGDKQAGDGFKQVPIEDLDRGLDLVRGLKDTISKKDRAASALDQLEGLFEKMRDR